MAGCRFPWQHPSATIGNIPKPTTQQLLNAMRNSFRDVSAFHVVMRVQNAGSTTGSQFQIRNADGDIIIPDKIKAQATVILSGQSVTVNLVGIGRTEFITDPVTGQWRVINGAFDLRTLTNADTGIISLLGKLQHLSAPIDGTVNNIPCWLITGQMDPKYLAFLTGGGAPAGTMLQTSACIGKADSLLYQFSVTGQAAASYTPQTTLSFLLSNYNEHVSITAPQV